MDEKSAQLGLALRKAAIRDVHVLNAMQRIPRELFVVPSLKSKAFYDENLPIDCNQMIMKPSLVAFMTEQLQLTKQHKVLEIGTGSGYHTAILSCLSRRVYSLEYHDILYRKALHCFKNLNLNNITSMLGDGMKGWSTQAPFDRIIVTATVKEISTILMNQLKCGGILIIPVEIPEHSEKQQLIRMIRLNEGFKRECLRSIDCIPFVNMVELNHV